MQRFGDSSRLQDFLCLTLNILFVPLRYFPLSLLFYHVLMSPYNTISSLVQDLVCVPTLTLRTWSFNLKMENITFGVKEKALA